MTTAFRRLLRLALFQFRLRASAGFFWVLMVVSPVAYLMLAYFGLINGSTIQQTHIMVAVGLTQMWSSVVFGAGFDIERERMLGTLESIIATPTSLFAQMFLKALTNALCGLVPLGIVLVLGLGVFRWTLAIDVWFFVLALIVIVFAMSAVGLLVCAFFSYSRSSRTYLKTLQSVMKIAGGFWVPVTALSTPFRMVGTAFPPAWMVLALDDWANGRFFSAFLNIGVAIVLSIALIGVAYRIMRILERHTRSAGSLALY